MWQTLSNGKVGLSLRSRLQVLGVILAAAFIFGPGAHASSITLADVAKMQHEPEKFQAFVDSLDDMITTKIENRDPQLAAQIRHFFLNPEQGQQSPGYVEYELRVKAIMEHRPEANGVTPESAKVDGVIMDVMRDHFGPQLQAMIAKSRAAAPVTKPKKP